MVKVRLETSREHVAEPARLRDPVGAVEELIWNAVDADAEHVVVTLERNDLGGVDRIPVQDDGTGMPAEHCEEYLLLDTAARLDTLRRLEGGFVDPCVSAAMHAVRFAATIIWPTAPHMPPPGYRQDSEGILELIAHWREAALQIGEFAPPPTLHLVSDTAPPA
ncbi:ATP-binding protein [Streptomyces sp. NPDC058307]|uniref:ATP-binding protein n=1 Tax=Streptomyces sp. NPDC058307 TaxID=3346439 RepID=UPI0036EBEE5D